MKGDFESSYRATVDSDFLTKEVKVEDKEVALQVTNCLFFEKTFQEFIFSYGILLVKNVSELCLGLTFVEQTPVH